jgi:hypothetical protein
VLLVSAAHAEWKFSGYTQLRYNLWDSAVDDDSFDARRARLKFEGPVFGDTTTFKIQLELAGLDDDHGEVELKDLNLSRKLGHDVKATLGYQPIQFGYEVPVSSSKRLPFERSEIAKRLFPGERTIGAYVAYHPKPTAGRLTPQFDAAYTNGMWKWTEGSDNAGFTDEDTDSWAWFVRAQVPIVGSSGVVGASFMGAQRVRDVMGVSTDFGSENAFGLHARYDTNFGLAVQGEYYDGEILDVDNMGWYAMGEYEFKHSPWTLFYRFDTCDREDKVIDFERHTAGAAWQLSKNERITFQAEAIDGFKYSSPAASVTNFGVQYQIAY